MKYSIITYGCQMNISDSERIKTALESMGYMASKTEEADLVIANMCSVRQSAVDRVFGLAQKLQTKNQKPKTKNPIMVLTGCVLEKDKKKFSKKFDYVLAADEIASSSFAELMTPRNDTTSPSLRAKRSNLVSASVPIMTGCNNFCSYCVVPYTRGREASRSEKEILEEVKNYISQGKKEIWLLGQNVNSFKGFPSLLKKVSNIKGDFWIKFTSSHPKDFSEELISVMAESKKAAKYLNLPVQSGDDKVLKNMNRHYTAKEYLQLVKKIRKAMPEISLSTDVIVGFPNETKKQFENTAKLFREVKYDMAYINKYSPRPGTAAEKMKDNVPFKEKKRRERVLTQILAQTALEKNKTIKTTKVLFDQFENGFLTGKSEGNKTVKAKGEKALVGEFRDVRIISATPWGLKGEIV